MTVAELFDRTKLSLRGPVPWGMEVPETLGGIYVIARGGDPSGACVTRDLKFNEPLLHNLRLDRQQESLRWLVDEPVLYIGRTTQPLCKRISQFYMHNVLKLLTCDLWVYWSPTSYPKEMEKEMLSVFQVAAGKIPFANGQFGKPRRIRLRGSL